MVCVSLTHFARARSITTGIRHSNTLLSGHTLCGCTGKVCHNQSFASNLLPARQKRGFLRELLTISLFFFFEKQILLLPPSASPNSWPGLTSSVFKVPGWNGKRERGPGKFCGGRPLIRSAAVIGSSPLPLPWRTRPPLPRQPPRLELISSSGSFLQPPSPQASHSGVIYQPIRLSGFCHLGLFITRNPPPFTTITQPSLFLSPQKRKSERVSEREEKLKWVTD